MARSCGKVWSVTRHRCRARRWNVLNFAVHLQNVIEYLPCGYIGRTGAIICCAEQSGYQVLFVHIVGHTASNLLSSPSQIECLVQATSDEEEHCVSRSDGTTRMDLPKRLCQSEKTDDKQSSERGVHTSSHDCLNSRYGIENDELPVTMHLYTISQAVSYSQIGLGSGPKGPHCPWRFSTLPKLVS
jgi:hypothetical protein